MIFMAFMLVLPVALMAFVLLVLVMPWLVVGVTFVVIMVVVLVVPLLVMPVLFSHWPCCGRGMLRRELNNGNRR